MPQLQDFQFFHQDRLNELYEKEQAFELHKHSLAGREAAARAQVHRPFVLPFIGAFAVREHTCDLHQVYFASCIYICLPLPCSLGASPIL